MQLFGDCKPLGEASLASHRRPEGQCWSRARPPRQGPASPLSFREDGGADICLCAVVEAANEMLAAKACWPSAPLESEPEKKTEHQPLLLHRCRGTCSWQSRAVGVPGHARVCKAVGVPKLWVCQGIPRRARAGVVQVQGGPGCVRGLSWKRALEEQDLAKGRKSPGCKKEETVQWDPQIIWGSWHPQDNLLLKFFYIL